MDVGGRETRSVSGTVYARPSERFSLKLYSEYSVFTDDITAVWGFPTAEFANCNPAGSGGPAWICGEVPDLDIAISRLGFPAVFDDQFKTQAVEFDLWDEILLKTGDSLFFDNITAHAIADYEFDSGVTVNAIAAYHKNRSQGLEESTQDIKDGFLPCLIAGGCGRPFGQYLFLVDRAGEDLSLEARVQSAQDQRLRWTLGVSYVDFDTTSASEGEINFLSVRQFSGPGKTAVKTPAVFGGLYYDVTNDFTVNAEIRYQVDRLRSTPNIRLDPSTVIPAKFKSLSPRVTLEYALTDDANLYASYATGTRPGTVNNGLFSLNPLVLDILSGLGAVIDVDEEKIEQFELGLKGRFLDGRLQTTMAAYIGTLKNQQIGNTVFVQTPEFTNTIGFINNAGKTDIHGFEIEAQALITDQLTVNGHFGLNASDIKTDRCADCIRLGLAGDASVGNRLSGTPETTGGMAGTYTIPVSGDGDWYGRAEYAYVGSQYATRANLTKTDAAHKFNFRAGFRTDAYTIETYVTNAFNDRTPRTIRLHTDLPTFGTALKIQLPERRQWGLRGTYNF